MNDPEKTDPNLQSFKEATAKADPWADRLLAWATASPWTPWIIVAWTIVCGLIGWKIGRP